MKTWSLRVAALALAAVGAWAADPPWIFGLHDDGGEPLMAQKGRRGWVVVALTVGADPNDRSGGDFSRLADQGYGVIVRMDHAWYPGGAIPVRARYADFAARCANYVAATRGCDRWVIGNEMNWVAARPGVEIDSSGRIIRPGEVITPYLYAECYRLCRDAIRARTGGSASPERVLVGATAPWNAQTTYTSRRLGRETNYWVDYFRDILETVQGACDGFALHAYTHGNDPNLVFSEERPWSQWPGAHFHFRVYRDFLDAVPSSMRSLPAFITEADPDDPWADTNSGWVRNAYAEINAWNADPLRQKVRCLALYRWRSYDRWAIERKGGVQADFLQAMDNDYRWTSGGPGGPDVVVESVRSIPAAPVVGQEMRFECRVRNTGTGATPADVVIGVGYSVGGRQVGWGSVAGPLPAGGAVTIGTGSAPWRPASAGTVTLTAVADDVNRFWERDETNNARSVSVTVASPSPSVRAMRVTASVLNVRSGPSTSFAILGQIASGQIYISDLDQGGWRRVWFDHRQGWCWGAFLTSASGGTGVAVTGTLNVRTGPSTSYATVGQVHAGERFHRDAVGGTYGTWVRIFYRGQAYWIWNGPTRTFVEY